MAAPNASANVRQFQKSGADTGNTQLSERIGAGTQLKKSLSYNLKFLSKLSDRHFLLRITVGVAGTIAAHHSEIFPFGR
jgi:hypothetical protein